MQLSKLYSSYFDLYCSLEKRAQNVLNASYTEHHSRCNLTTCLICIAAINFIPAHMQAMYHISLFNALGFYQCCVQQSDNKYVLVVAGYLVEATDH